MGQSTEGNPQAGTGAVEQPTSPTSPTGSQPLPDYVVALQSQIADVTNLVKGIQKGTDKQIGQVRTDVKRILELKEQGLNESQINRELWIDQQMNTQNAPVQPPAGSEQKNTSLDVDTVVSSLQFQPNDPALAALKIKYAGDPQGMVKAAADLRLSQLSTPNPSPATAPALQGNPPVSGVDKNALYIKLSEYQRSPSRFKKEIAEITKQLEDSGW